MAGARGWGGRREVVVNGTVFQFRRMSPGDDVAMAAP